MLPQAYYTIKARRWPVLFLFFLGGLPFYIAYLTNSEEKAMLYVAIGLTIFCFLVFFVLTRLKIHLYNDRLEVEMLFNKQEVLWNDIVASTIGWQVEGMHGANLVWTFQKTSKTTEISLGYYSRNNMQIIAQELVDRAKNAAISNKIFDMAEGKFPWYLF